MIDWLRGAPIWPDLSIWREGILFLELSEEAIPPAAVMRILRSLAAIGVLNVVRGILFGRPYGDENRFADYDAALQSACREAGCDAIPLVTRMDFGHTDPMLTIPYGIEAEIDCDRQEIRFLEAAVLS